MSLDVFESILDRYGYILKENDAYVVLGGGEPTLNPEFWKFVEVGSKLNKVWVATNGSNKKDALKICDMAKRNLLHGVLSLDEWHDPIDLEVIEAFTEGLSMERCEAWSTMWNPYDKIDQREIRSVKIPLFGGRAKKMKKTRSGCPCPGIQFKVTGDIYPCGCEDAPKIGTYDKGISDLQYKYYDIWKGCHKNINKVYNEGLSLST